MYSKNHTWGNLTALGYSVNRAATAQTNRQIEEGRREESDCKFDGGWFELFLAPAVQAQKIPRIGFLSQSGDPDEVRTGDRPDLFALYSIAEAQPIKVPRIGYLPGGASSLPQPFLQGLRDRGYFEGKNILFEFRTTEGKGGRSSDLAAELIRLKLDILVTEGKTNGVTCRSPERFRSSDQSQGREADWPDDSTERAGESGQGDSIKQA